MSHIRPLFVTHDVFTAIGRPYAIYPLKYRDRPLVGINTRVVGPDITTAHSLHLSVNAISIPTVSDIGIHMIATSLKSATDFRYIVDCEVYSSLIRDAHAKFNKRHNVAKRAAFIAVLLNRGIDIYLAMSIARTYIG